MSTSELKIKTEGRPKSRLSIEVEIPASRCKASYEEAVSRLSRSVKLPGFRKGKVPKAVLLQQIGVVRIRATAIEKLLDNTWREALKQKSIDPLCEPEIKNGFEGILESFNPNEDLTVTYETDVEPTPTLKTSKGLTAEAEEIIFDPKKIDELIEQSRKQLATVVPLEESRPAKIGDIAVVSFKGSYTDDGSEIEGGSAESMDIDLEKGRMIPGFIEGIVGMSLNEEKNIECEFPEDYAEEKARGRKANFSITLKDLKNRELPKLDDAFAKQASDKKTLKELKDDLELRLKKDASERNKSNRQDALLNALVKELEIDLPETLIQQEIRKLIEQTASEFAQQGMDVKSMFTEDLVKSLIESSRDEAENNLRKSFALKVLAQQEKIEASEKEVEAKFNDLKKEISKEKGIDYERLKEAVKEDLLRDKLLDWLEENNTITEKDAKSTVKTKKKDSSTTESKKNKDKNKKSATTSPNS